MRKLILLVLVVAVVAALPKLLGGTDLVSEAGKALGLSKVVKRTDAMVLRVRDGDTIRVRVLMTGVEAEVRILGIDTPEVGDQAECGGDTATAALQARLPEGTTVQLENDPSQADRDRYDRLLRYVSVVGNDLGLAQVRAGVARTFVFGGEPFDRTRDYRRAQRKARAQDAGLWAACWR